MKTLSFPFRLSPLQWRFPPAAIFAVLLCLSSLPQYGSMAAPTVPHPEKGNPLLAPCTIYSQLLQQLPFKSDNFERWPEEYKQTVQGIVEEHFSFLQSAPQCTSASLLQPQGQLQSLASRLPTWNGSRGKTPQLKQTDIGLVLLEFLNVYECAIQERFYFLTRDAWETVYNKENESSSPSVFGASSSSKNATYGLVLEEMFNEMPVLEKELLSARDILNRTLAVIGGMNRLVALQKELQCIEGASLDIRNATALAAEAASCLPRVWNAKDPLRDLP